MGFRIVHGTPQMIWAPVLNDDTLYEGQIVRARDEGVAPLHQAMNANDSASKSVAELIQGSCSSGGQAVFGVVVGTNLRTPTFDGTYNQASIAWATPPAATTETYFGVEGPWAKGDTQAMVKVALLDSSIILRGEVRNSSSVVTTGMTVGTLTASTGVTATTATMGVTTVQNFSTLYWRSGTNAGTYRILTSASPTTHTWDNSVANSTGTSEMNGDTVVTCNLRPIGPSRMQLSNEALWIDGSAAVTADYFAVDVIRLDLSEAGREYADFRFTPAAFDGFKTTT